MKAMDVNSEYDGVQDFHELSALAEAGKFKEALDKHLWFHEASREITGMGGVRLSYALDTWMELAEKYSPAMEALINLRNTSRDMLLKGNGTFDNFHDLFAINRVLGDSEDTFSVFVEIHNNYPEQAKRYYQVVEELIVEKKAYDICQCYITDPKKKYSQIQHMHEMNIKLIKNNPVMDNDEFREYTKESFVNGVCQLIEILLALHKNDLAKEIQKQALDYFDNKLIRAAICS
jgi:hypothetical protein